MLHVFCVPAVFLSLSCGFVAGEVAAVGYGDSGDGRALTLRTEPDKRVVEEGGLDKPS